MSFPSSSEANTSGYMLALDQARLALTRTEQTSAQTTSGDMAARRALMSWAERGGAPLQ